jgi:hypothetical protein
MLTELGPASLAVHRMALREDAGQERHRNVGPISLVEVRLGAIRR